MSAGDGDAPDRRRALLRTALRLAVVVLVAYAIHLVLSWSLDRTDELQQPRGGRLRLGLLLIMLAAYVVLLSIPFVPGVEIGIALLAMEGGWIAPFVYGATVGGLTLAFVLGSHLPYRYLHRVFADLGLRRACRMLETLEPLSGQKRLALLRRHLPDRLAPHAVRWRYLLLAGLFNMPGSALLGGGGGIAMVAGLSGVFGFCWTLLTIALSVAPVPAIVWFFGMESLI